MVKSEQVFAQWLRSAVASMHVSNSRQVIRFPSANGAFPADILLHPPPVVLDANRLRSDILRACRTGQRTVLVNAANGGLLRLFCAQHVVDEVAKHSGKWTEGGPVSRTEFLRTWLLEYLPLIRVVRPNEGHLALLGPEEAARIRRLAMPDQDPDDVPSAILALLLRAFYLSNDRKALRAVYGDDFDLADHAQWVDVLKAGGDAGELGKMFALLTNLTGLIGMGLFGGAKRIVQVTSPWIILPVGVLAGWRLVTASEETKRKMGSFGQSVLMSAVGGFITYMEVRERFERVTPKMPSWHALAATNPPGVVLARACMHTLARSAMSDRSAEELAKELPSLNVAQGVAKVRGTLRAMDCFQEVWRGRWQMGEVASALMPHLETLSPPTVG